MRAELRVLVDDRLGHPARLAEQRHVVRVAQRGQPQVALPLLAGAEHRALAAQLEVDLGQLEAVGRARHRGQPLVALLAAEQVAPARRAAPPDPAAQLVQLGDAEAVGVLDDHDGGLGHVDADLDDGRRHQHLELAGAEAVHRPPPVSAAAIWPCSSPTRSPASSPAASRSYSSVADLASTRGESLDQRADDEGAVPGRHLVAHPVPGPLLAGVRLARAATRSSTGDAARRQLVEHGEVEVAEDHHGGRARDGRRRHHQQVRVAVGRPWPAASPAAPRRSGAARRSRRTPSEANATSSVSSAWVPTTMSTSPARQARRAPRRAPCP